MPPIQLRAGRGAGLVRQAVVLRMRMPFRIEKLMRRSAPSAFFIAITGIPQFGMMWSSH
ncbi:MAG TPA: hypothetical protein VK052_07330 [Zeimonas sp.]|nr:hypothetical protein [Zeimonas sp.]